MVTATTLDIDHNAVKLLLLTESEDHRQFLPVQLFIIIVRPLAQNNKARSQLLITYTFDLSFDREWDKNK